MSTMNLTERIIAEKSRDILLDGLKEALELAEQWASVYEIAERLERCGADYLRYVAPADHHAAVEGGAR
jgi:hypothetical protein